jgi:hypothetical protein
LKYSDFVPDENNIIKYNFTSDFEKAKGKKLDALKVSKG